MALRDVLRLREDPRALGPGAPQLRHTVPENAFVAHLTLRFNWVSCIFFRSSGRLSSQVG